MGFLYIIVSSLANVIHFLLNAYMIIVVVSALISWVNPDPYNPIVRFLRQVTEPVFYKVRQWMPFTVIGGFDLSPIVVLVGIQLADRLIQYFVMSIFMRPVI